MERFILLCVILSSSQQGDTGCPTTVTLWKEKEAEFNCATNKFYHCLRNEKQQTVQTCLERSWVQPGFCPEFNSVANEIDVFLCKESLGKCPEATFWSNELHKYSACLNATNIENKISEQNEQEEDRDENDSSIRLIVIPVAGVLVLVVLIAIAIASCHRKNKSKQRKEGTELKGIKDVDTNEKLLHREEEYNFQEAQVIKETERVDYAEEIDNILDKHLHYPGDNIIIVYGAGQVPFIAETMKRKFPRFIEIENFDDWSGMTDKEGYSVLLSCVMKEFSLSGHLNKYEDKIKDIVSDISNLNLRLVIPIRSDKVGKIANNQLFQRLKHVYLTRDLEI